MCRTSLGELELEVSDSRIWGLFVKQIVLSTDLKKIAIVPPKQAAINKHFYLTVHLHGHSALLLESSNCFGL